MLKGLTLILCCQLAGELLTRWIGGPIPGPVVGMVILFVLLLFLESVARSVKPTGEALLAHFSLLFVPAGVGVVLHFKLLGENWLPLSVALVVSTVLTIIVTGALMAWFSRSRDE